MKILHLTTTKYFILIVLIQFKSCISTKITQNQIVEKFGARGLELDPDIVEDSFLRVDELIKKYNYPSEVHYITTEDGYILTVHRIPTQGGQPIFLQHGLSDSSAGFIVIGPQVALGYLLSDSGYDVWLGNSRGNKYSRNHTSLDPDKGEEFWNFSWHEMGIYDLPATVDYILDRTKFEKLQYIGHSQGCPSFMIMCSIKPEYNSKIKSMHAFAPAVYLSQMSAPLDFFSNFAAFDKIPNKEVLNYSYVKLYLKSPASERTCTRYLSSIFGNDLEQINMTMVPVLLSHWPSGASIKQIKHFQQSVTSGRFQQFDYGHLKNLEKYGNVLPPKYDLGKVTAPVIVYYSLNDKLVHAGNALKTYSELGNKAGLYKVPLLKFNHADFIWAKDARKLLYEKVLEDLKKF